MFAFRRAPARSLSLALLVLASAFLAGPGQARDRRVVVGREMTWLHLPSGQERVDGRPIGTVSIRRKVLLERCRSFDPDFEGYARVRPVGRRGNGWKLRVECLGMPEAGEAPNGG